MRKALVAAAAIAIGFSAAASAGTGHQWDDLYWGVRGSRPALDLRYAFSPSTADKWLPVYLTGSRNAFAKWNDDPRSPLDLRDFGEASEKDSFTCDPDSLEILVCADDFGQATGWTGQAQIWSTSGDRIVRANAKMNDAFFENEIYYDRAERREFTMCHELGHAFGLGHLDEEFGNANLGSCMDYTSNVIGALDNRDPGQVDWDVLTSATMYGLVSIAAPPPTATTPPENDGGRFAILDPARDRGSYARGGGSASSGSIVVLPQRYLPQGQFGGILEYDASGRPISFVKDLRGGRKVTFVLWAGDYRPEGSVDPETLPRPWRESPHPL